MNRWAGRSVILAVAWLGSGAILCAPAQESGQAAAQRSSPAQRSAAARSGANDAQVESDVLRALAGVPELSGQNIQTSTVYGEVTLSGIVHDEALRTAAESTVARTRGVKKVIDELTLGDAPSNAPADQVGAAASQTETENGTAPAGEVLQPDGTYAPAAPAEPTSGQQAPVSRPDQPMGQTPAGQPGYSQSIPEGQRPYNNGSQYPPPYAPGPGQPYNPQVSQAGQGNGYGGSPYSAAAPGQAGGRAVTIPSGSSLQVRLDRGIDANHIQPGTRFTGTVMNDVAASGEVAIPRGAAVEGTVVDVRKAGTFKGGGELALQLTSVTLGGRNFPMSTEVWDREGHDKTVSTVDTTLGLGALGAVFGGLAGGGAGAAIGAGVGGALGVGASAASPNGRVLVPPESVLTFALNQPLAVLTVSQSEMQRLSYAAGSGLSRPELVRRADYPGYGGYGVYGGYPAYGGYPGYGGYRGYGVYGRPYAPYPLFGSGSGYGYERYRAYGYPYGRYRYRR